MRGYVQHLPEQVVGLRSSVTQPHKENCQREDDNVSCRKRAGQEERMNGIATDCESFFFVLFFTMTEFPIPTARHSSSFCADQMLSWPMKQRWEHAVMNRKSVNCAPSVENSVL